MTPRSVVALVLLAGLCGCFNPDDIFPVKGSVASVDPVEGQVVALLRESAAESTSECSEARPFKETTAGADGKFGFEVFRAQAQKLSGFGKFCFRAQVRFASGSSVFTDIEELSSEYHLPPLPDWRARPSRVDGVVRVEPIAPLPEVETLTGGHAVHRATLWTLDGGNAWLVDDRVLDLMTNNPARQPLALDGYAAEDFVGEVELRARLIEERKDTGPFGDGDTTSLEATAGERLPVTGTRTPISRGASCAPLADPCPLTDGQLTPVMLGSARSVTVALPVPTPLSAVVLRGADTDDVLIGVILKDADGGALLPVQHLLPPSTWGGASVRVRRDGGVTVTVRSAGRYTVIPLDAGVPVSSVTVSFPGGVESMRELSLFE